MTRSIAMLAILGLFAAPALATEPTTPGATAAHAAALNQAHDARQAQKLLLQQGYTGVAELERIAAGRYVGTAVKDGKTIIVGVDLPRPQAGISN